MSDTDLITLEVAAGLIPGANANTLKRRARAGKLTVYRPGKAYLTTPADVHRMVAACRVDQKAPGCISAPIAATAAPAHGLSVMAIASAGLDSALTQALASAKGR